MTNRLSYPNYWAEGGTATDPDLDTEAPSFIEGRYENVGWKAEKPPEFWQNFLTQISDTKMLAMMVEGLMYYDESVAYQEGAIYKRDGVVYKIEGGVERECLSPSRDIYLGLIKALQDSYNNHLSADNPHKDTMKGLVGGGYEKPEFDGMLGDPKNPRTIEYHKLQVGPIHGETAENIGTLSAEKGGSFTGPVSIGNIMFTVAGDKYIHYNLNTGRLEVVNGTVAFGIDTGDSGWVVNTAGSWEMVTKGNYDRITAVVNSLFYLPPPVFSATFSWSLSEIGVGKWKISTVGGDPNYTKKGSLVIGQNSSIFQFTDIKFPATVFVEYEDGAEVIHTAMIDAADWNSVHPNTQDLYFMINTVMQVNPPAFAIRTYAVYPQLTAYQKTTLKVN